MLFGGGKGFFNLAMIKSKSLTDVKSDNNTNEDYSPNVNKIWGLKQKHI